MLQHCNSLSNKMDNSLLAVRDINHKYIVVDNIVIDHFFNYDIIHVFPFPNDMFPDSGVISL